MKENIWIKLVAGFFSVAGIFLLLSGILGVLAGIAIPSFGASDNNIKDIVLIFGIVSIPLSIYSIRVSSGLHRLQKSSYRAAFSISGILLISSALYFISQGFSLHAFSGDIAPPGVQLIFVVSLVSIVTDGILFMNRNFFVETTREITNSKVVEVEASTRWM